MNLTLKRISENSKGTFGVLMRSDGTPLCVTLENAWKDNMRNVSRIPEGKYECVPHNGARYMNVWRLEDVPGRSAILIHAGNTQNDTRGCILVGRRFYSGGILESRAALSDLRDVLPEEFTLTITNETN